MPRRLGLYAWIGVVVAVVMATLSAPSAAQSGFSAADSAVFKAYVLDSAKVNRFISGISALTMAKQTDNAIAEDYESLSSEDGTSIAQMRARLARHPRVFAFFQRQNLTADDVILIPLVLTFAGVAVAVPGQMADVVSPAQLNFYRSNAPLMQRFGEANEALENDSR